MLRVMDIAHRPFILWALEEMKIEGNVLEIGIGSGFALRNIEKRAGNAYGIDISDAALAMAGRRIKRADVKKGSAEDIPYRSDFFDAAVSFDSAYYWEEEAFAEIRRVLKEDGRLYIALEASDPEAAPGWIRKDPRIRIRKPEEIIRLLERFGFAGRVQKRQGSRVVIEAMIIG